MVAKGSSPDAAGKAILRADVQPWSKVLLEYSAPSQSILDLGSGRGDHSAFLAVHGRHPTLVDFSSDNLRFSRELFNAIGGRGRFCQVDITQPLPFESNSFDVVFSCGVFEYFDRMTVRSILAEAFRVASRRVIIMVPNAFSVVYRVGKWYMERTGRWNWGGEVPSYTLKPDFESVGAHQVTEFSVSPQSSLHFVTMPRVMTSAYRRVFRAEHESKPTMLRQGYLLVTIGDKPSGSR